MWAWLKQYGYLPLFFLGCLAGWLLFRKYRQEGTPIQQTKLELQAIAAYGEVKKKEAELGTVEARNWVLANYQAQILALEGVKRTEAEVLRDNPAELAKFLVRAGSNS